MIDQHWESIVAFLIGLSLLFAISAGFSYWRLSLETRKPGLAENSVIDAYAKQISRLQDESNMLRGSISSKSEKSVYDPTTSHAASEGYRILVAHVEEMEASHKVSEIHKSITDEIEEAAEREAWEEVERITRIFMPEFTVERKRDTINHVTPTKTR